MHAIRRPGAFQGRNRTKNYFEGWYFKITDPSGSNTLAFIPGISYGENGNDRHAFIQVLDAVRGRSEYFRFDVSAFGSSEKKFEISIGENRFSREYLEVHLENSRSRYSGRLTFSKIESFPRSIFSPGIMGPFLRAPMMECYHDIINIRQALSGTMETLGGSIDFEGGTGYLEKDWGTSFPETWIWIQCNHFDTPGASFMLSYARIPFMGTSFKGFIAFVKTDSSFYRMATYNHSRVTSLDIGEKEVYLIAENRKLALNVRVTLEPGYILRAPRNGLMDSDLTESLSIDINISMIEKKGKLLFNGRGKNAGVELGGDTDWLMPR